MTAADPYVGVSLAWFKEEVEKRAEKAVSVEIFDKGKPYADNQILSRYSDRLAKVS